MTANDAMFGDTIMRISAGSRDRQILQLSEIYIRVNAPARVEPTAAAIEQLMAVRHTAQKDVQVRVPLELLRQAGEQQKVFNFIMVGIACLSLLVGGIGIMNISLATVTERTREIGVRRALGGKRQHIITQFLIETTCLSVAGGIVGVVGGIGLAVLVGWVSAGSYPTHVTIWSVALSFGISASVGILFGLYPAIVAAHKDPIEALRHDCFLPN
jgi:putative ABC transport system permease protein